MKEMAYRRETTKPFEQVTSELEKLIPERGFRVLAIHDTKATLAEKGFEIEPLKIFEVCNAGFAYKALGKNIDTALFMPCKIVVRSEKGKTHLALMKPSLIAEFLPGSGLEELAGEVEKQIIGIMNEVA